MYGPKEDPFHSDTETAMAGYLPKSMRRLLEQIL